MRKAILEVRDHGLGLAPGEAERVFERFYRVDSSRRRDTGGGSGLGLSIARQIIYAHEGRIGVNSQPGKITEFFFDLPSVPAVATA